MEHWLTINRGKPLLRLTDEYSRALRANQATATGKARFLEVGDGQGDMAGRANDP
jgi:hypothetical protein